MNIGNDRKTATEWRGVLKEASFQFPTRLFVYMNEVCMSNTWWGSSTVIFSRPILDKTGRKGQKQYVLGHSLDDNEHVRMNIGNDRKRSHGQTDFATLRLEIANENV